MAVELPKPFEDRISSISDRELEVRGQSREDLRGYYEKRVLDDIARSPSVGAPAPDVQLELLSATGQRTGAYKSISDFRGLPVGLIFGSFT